MDSITDVIDEAVAEVATKIMVVLLHDVRTPDKDDIGNIVDELENYADGHAAVIEYVRMKDLS